MQLKDIVAISGQGGLFKILSHTKNGMIVENLEDQKRIPVTTSAKISSLEDIAIFTKEEDMPLKAVFTLIYKNENGGPAINPKTDNVKLKIYFEKVMPDFDKNRVYVSDIKKVITWYNILQRLDLIKPDEENEEVTAPAKE